MYRSEHLVADVKVVMGEASPLMRQDTVVGILRGILGHADPEGAALFHAFEDEVDAESRPVLDAALCGVAIDWGMIIIASGR